MPSDSLPTNYRLIGPPDLLHDLMLDFQDVGWQCTVVRWQAVISAPPDEHAHAPPLWPAEITLAGISHTDHVAACLEHFVVLGA